MAIRVSGDFHETVILIPFAQHLRCHCSQSFLKISSDKLRNDVIRDEETVLGDSQAGSILGGPARSAGKVAPGGVFHADFAHRDEGTAGNQAADPGG